MTNPCKECLVKAMCQEGCHKLERYIYNICTPNNSLSSTYFMLADDIRQGITTIEAVEEKAK